MHIFKLLFKIDKNTEESNKKIDSMQTNVKEIDMSLKRIKRMMSEDIANIKLVGEDNENIYARLLSTLASEYKNDSLKSIIDDVNFHLFKLKNVMNNKSFTKTDLIEIFSERDICKERFVNLMQLQNKAFFSIELDHTTSPDNIGFILNNSDIDINISDFYLSGDRSYESIVVKISGNDTIEISSRERTEYIVNRIDFTVQALYVLCNDIYSFKCNI